MWQHAAHFRRTDNNASTGGRNLPIDADQFAYLRGANLADRNVTYIDSTTQCATILRSYGPFLFLKDGDKTIAAPNFGEPLSAAEVDVDHLEEDETIAVSEAVEHWDTTLQAARYSAAQMPMLEALVAKMREA